MASLVVVSPDHLEPFETQFELQEKVFSFADSFDIKNEEGEPVFKLEGKNFSFHERKTLLDMSENPVAVITKKLMSAHGTWEIHSADGEVLLASVRDTIFAIKDNADVIIHEFGPDPYLQVKGDFRGKNFEVVHDEDVVATVQRKSIFKDVTRIFTGNDHYSLTVAPNVDRAFAVALGIIFDGMFHNDDD
eukprot:TRINITY_DN22756_c0_g1_i1.p1 TRINITY_DN22756_c0_g1~~TRINITY_DN22756_c0_g1_i1.p1  ORF type:complete len:198 (-),score=41.19 TRINITY_DN22756_c0_g1_i1:244-813(-)